MKIRTCHVLAAALLALALPVRAGYVDITVNDGVIHHMLPNGSDPRGNDPWGIPIDESGSVSDPANNTAAWDLRAFAFDINKNTLTVVSGFDPLTKTDGFGLGDIFIDTNNSFNIPSPLLGNTNSEFGFEYAIDLINPWSPSTPNKISYQVLSLAADTQFQLPAYGNSYPELAKGAPALVSNLESGTVLSPVMLTPKVLELTDAEVLANLGLKIGMNGGTNYVFTFDLSSLSLYNGATFRLTQECGNDLLVGYLAPGVAAVPETSTWVMGFLALGAVVFMVRRNAKLSV